MRPCQLCGRSPPPLPKPARRVEITGHAITRAHERATGPSHFASRRSWPSLLRDDQHDDDQPRSTPRTDRCRGCRGRSRRAIAATDRRWSLAAQDPDERDREAVREIVADRDRRVERRAAAAAACCRLIAGVQGPPGLPDAERIEDREHRQQARARRAGSTGTGAPARVCARPNGTTRRAPRAATTRSVSKMSVLLGIRPRANIQHSGQIDETTHSTTTARSSFVMRTLIRSPCTMRTSTPPSTARHEHDLDRLARPEQRDQHAAVDAADERLGREEHVRGPHGALRDEHEERRKTIANGIKSTTKPMTTAASPRANSAITPSATTMARSSRAPTGRGSRSSCGAFGPGHRGDACRSETKARRSSGAPRNDCTAT